MPRPDHLQGSHVGEMCECGGSKYRYSWLCRSCRTQANRLKINPRFAPSEVPDAVETAYAAGFYEGEGSVGFHAGSIRVSIGQKEPWPLQRVCRFFGGSLKLPTEKHTVWMLFMHGRLAEDFMSAIELHLSPRRVDQLNEARARLEAFRG